MKRSWKSRGARVASVALCWVAVFSAGAEPVAEVGERAVTLAEVDAAAGDALREAEAARYEAEQELYAARQAALQELLLPELMARAAQRRGMTVEALREAEVVARQQPVEEDLVRYVLGRIGVDPDDAPPRMVGAVRGMLAESARETREEELYQELLAEDSEVRLWLAPPRAPESVRQGVRGPETPALGPDDAPVTITVFADFRCPYCGQLADTLDTLRARYPESLRVVFRHALLNVDSPSYAAAQAAQCADDQGHFWGYHDALFGPWDGEVTSLSKLAEALGLDTERFTACLEEGAQVARIQADIAEGDRLELDGVPVAYVNGIRVDGAEDAGVFTALIDAELYWAKRDGQAMAADAAGPGAAAL